jgi:hypothetical protein
LPAHGRTLRPVGVLGQRPLTGRPPADPSRTVSTAADTTEHRKLVDASISEDNCALGVTRAALSL